MKWTKTNYGYAAGGGYLIEQVWAPNSKGYAWWAEGPGKTLGTHDSINEAKEACEAHRLSLALEGSI